MIRRNKPLLEPVPQPAGKSVSHRTVPGLEEGPNNRDLVQQAPGIPLQRKEGSGPSDLGHCDLPSRSISRPLTIQRKQFEAAPGSKVESDLRATVLQRRSTALRGRLSGVQTTVIQRHHGLTYDDDTVVDAEIYGIVEKATGNVVYVGQTCGQVGLAKRFDQHVAGTSGHPNNYTKKTHRVTLLETARWTQFETSCAEQYWIDRYGGKEGLDNKRNEISLAHFKSHVKKYPETYRGEAIGFPKGWKPKN